MRRECELWGSVASTGVGKVPCAGVQDLCPGWGSELVEWPLVWAAAVPCSSLRVATAERLAERTGTSGPPCPLRAHLPSGARGPAGSLPPEQTRTKHAPQALPCLAPSSAVAPGGRRPHPACTKAQAPRHREGPNGYQTELGADPRRGTRGRGAPNRVGGLTTQTLRRGEPAAFRLRQGWPNDTRRALHASFLSSCPPGARLAPPHSALPRPLQPRPAPCSPARPPDAPPSAWPHPAET